MDPQLPVTLCCPAAIALLAVSCALIEHTDGDGGFFLPTAMPVQVAMDQSKLEEARCYALTGEGSGCIIRGGRLVMAWGDQNQKYDLYSSTKSIAILKPHGQTPRGFLLRYMCCATMCSLGHNHCLLCAPGPRHRSTLRSLQRLSHGVQIKQKGNDR